MKLAEIMADNTHMSDKSQKCRIADFTRTRYCETRLQEFGYRNKGVPYSLSKRGVRLKERDVYEE